MLRCGVALGDRNKLLFWTSPVGLNCEGDPKLGMTLPPCRMDSREGEANGFVRRGGVISNRDGEAGSVEGKKLEPDTIVEEEVEAEVTPEEAPDAVVVEEEEADEPFGSPLNNNNSDARGDECVSTAEAE